MLWEQEVPVFAKQNGPWNWKKKSYKLDEAYGNKCNLQKAQNNDPIKESQEISIFTERLKNNKTQSGLDVRHNVYPDGERVYVFDRNF